jgi:hypothetical protein
MVKVSWLLNFATVDLATESLLLVVIVFMAMRVYKFLNVVLLQIKGLFLEIRDNEAVALSLKLK